MPMRSSPHHRTLLADLERRQYFSDSREPFSITVAGVELYIITSPQDMSLVYKNTTTLSFDDFIRDLHIAFAMSISGQDKMWNASKGKCLLHQANDLHREQLHPGPHLNSLTSKVLEQIEFSLCSYDVLVKEGHEGRTLSLYSWCADVLVYTVRDVHRLTDRYSTNANAFKISFWLLTYLLHHPVTLAAIRKETQECVINGEVNIDNLLRCALFNAAFDETLRLTSGASSARTVLSPTQLRNKTLRKDTKLLMPYRQLHFQEAVFGPQVKAFRPDRFLDKQISNSPDFKPFGGGITHCSGRFIARREVLAFVALVLHRYDIELADQSQALPRLDEQKPTLGVIGPMKGDDTTVQIKPRSIQS
ncbi:MAG: hypothetical protein Q9216_002994 [Gyalolechia sp. 2 TL-2023]